MGSEDGTTTGETQASNLLVGAAALEHRNGRGHRPLEKVSKHSCLLQGTFFCPQRGHFTAAGGGGYTLRGAGTPQGG